MLREGTGDGCSSTPPIQVSAVYCGTERHSIRAMKTSAGSLLGVAGVIACSSCASAFVVPTVTVRAGPAASASRVREAAPNSSRRTMRLSAEKKEEEEDQEPMDLDLEQMFEVKLPEFMCETCEAMNVDRVLLNLSEYSRLLTMPSTSCIRRVSTAPLQSSIHVYQGVR